jgi:TolB-like protein
MEADQTTIYRFDHFTLDLVRGMLLAEDGTELSLRPKSFALLHHFVANSGRLVDRDELMQVVWPGVFVTDDSIAQCITEIRRALGGDGQRLLRTIPRRGYRLAVSVSTADSAEVAVVPKDAPNDAILSDPAAATPSDPPAIAVLPFQNMSGDAEQEYFADGIVEEIITALSRIRWLCVIARNSSFTYKGQAVDIRHVGRDLGVRYVLEGSVRRSANQVRVTAQLIDASNGAHLWADHFDGPLEDVFELQDKIASSVAGVIEPTLQAAEARRSSDRPTRDLTAYDLYLRGYAIALSSASRFREALGFMEQAIARDPRYGPALSFASICYFRLVFDGHSDDPRADGNQAVDLARRSLLVGGGDPAIMAHAANVLLYFGEDADAMLALVDRALAVSPSFARGWYISGTMRIWVGQTDIGIEHVERSLRLSPRVRVGWVVSVIGIAYFLTKRFDEAVPKFLLSIQEDPSYPDPYRFLAACYAQMGRLDDAREVVTRLRAVTSVVVPSADHLRVPEQRELFLSGLRLAADEAD